MNENDLLDYISQTLKGLEYGEEENLYVAAYKDGARDALKDIENYILKS